MKEFLQRRQLKYTVYIIGLTLLILINTLLDPGTSRKAYGTIMLILLVGLIAGQIWFAIRQFHLNWFAAIIYGIIITLIGFYLSNTLVNAVAPISEVSYSQEEKILARVFLVSFLCISDLLWEIANKYYK